MAMCHLPDLGEALDDHWLRTLTRYNDGATHRDEIYARIRPRFTERTTAEWLEILDRCGVWAGPVYDYPQLERDPHVVATKTFTQQPQGDGVTVRTLRPPLAMSETPLSIRRGAPPLGAHTAEVLIEKLGYDANRVNQLIAGGAVGAAPAPRSPREEVV
jgi:crotonobetainyl-CoA:carnitine CoA-transferase CaiB-like acyl-CoA transferase